MHLFLYQPLAVVIVVVFSSRATASASIDMAELVLDQVFGRRDPFFFPASILEIIKLVSRVEH